MDDLVSGEWLVIFVGDVLEPYADEIDAAYFKRMYAGRTPEQVVARLIERAQRHAAVEGAITAGAYTAAVAALISSGGTASLVTLPASVVAFVTDLLFTTRLQLYLAYDISVLYSLPVDLDDPDEVRLLLRVALGERPIEEFIYDDDEEAGDDVQRAMKTVARHTAKVSRKALTVTGKQLLKRALIKLTLPVASIPIASAMNYYAAGRTARRAQRVYRDRAAARELGPKLAAAGAAEPRLLLEALWFVVDADERVDAGEAWLIDEVAATLKETEAGAEAVAAIRQLRQVDVDDLLHRLWKAPRDVRRGIFSAVRMAATTDRTPTRSEKGALSRLESACMR